ncbi:hypothetical protein ACM614_14010 [Streptomyces sp. 12297]
METNSAVPDGTLAMIFVSAPAPSPGPDARLIAGEIPAAKDAIPHLCPELKPVLEVAESGFTDGALKDPEAGRYRALTPGPDCTWQAKNSAGKSLASGPGLGAGADTKIIAKVPSGTAEFVSTGCYAWIPA